MEQLLSRPEIQSAVLPFAIALAVALGLRALDARAWAWAMLAAFALSAALINGLTLTPLTGTRKIILLLLAALLGAALLPRVLPRSAAQRWLVYLAALSALAWVFWAVVARMPPAAIALHLAGAISLFIVLQHSFERLGSDPARLHAAGFSLLLGTGLASMAAASALLGQLGLALAAACGGAFLAWVLLGAGQSARQPLAPLPYVLGASLLGLASVMFARLPWYALIPLALIPLAVSLVPQKFESRFLRALLASIPGLLIALAVAAWVWQTSASDSGY